MVQVFRGTSADHIKIPSPATLAGLFYALFGCGFIMTDRLTATFAAARASGRKLLCPFLTAGYPSLPATVELLTAIQRAAAPSGTQPGGGIGCIELGIPFSDPVADGPTIQASFTHALAAGVTVQGIFDAVAQARARGVTLPILAMVSFSIIFKWGTVRFAQACQQAGLDGVVLPDLPLEEAPAVVAAMHQAGLRSILLIAPGTDPERRAKIAQLCDGFVYYLSVAGITGERAELPPDIAQNVAALRQLTTVPVCVGFGISTPEHVRQVVALADGAIVGSALIRQITEKKLAPLPELAAHVEAFVRHLATGTV